MELIEFASYLDKVNSVKLAEGLLDIYLSHFNIKAYAFTYYAGHIKSGSKLRYHMVSATLAPWHHHYLTQRYADVDRTLEENYHGTLPLFWDVNVQITQAKHHREKRIREESIGFGIHKGLSLPIHGPHYDFATLTLHQFRTETCLYDYQAQQFKWLSAAHIFYHHIRKLLDLHTLSPDCAKLTRREEQCLRLTAQSFRVEEIAKELKISIRTVNFHLQNANKKLGTNNKYQTINKYLGHNLASA